MTMTRQEMFDQVVRGLAAQGFEQSLDYGGTCAYQSPEGKRCAAGLLLTDAELAAVHPNYEGNNVYHLKDSGLFPERLEVEFVTALQVAHDYPGSGTPEGMRQKFLELADTWSLDATALDQEWEAFSGQSAPVL